MAKGYRPVARDQAFLFPPDMREWLPADHAVWLVIRVVEEHLDTGAFHALRRTGGAGAAGYDPDMLVTLLVWAYANKVTSSRRVEALCHQDVAFRVICAGEVPDHVTVARFRRQFPGAVGELFAQVLLLCARLGMGKVGTVALDGAKVAANASKDANRTEETLRKLAAESVAAHAAADAAEDAAFGDGRRGDEVPAAAADPRTRDERIAAALADLEAERAAEQQERAAKAAGHLEAAAAGTPKRGHPPAEVAVDVARLRLDREMAAQQARIAEWERQRAAGGRRRGRRPVPPGDHSTVKAAAAALARAEAKAEQAAAVKDEPGSGPVRNITDPDSRLMPVRGGGFLQGYNAQNVTSEDGLVIATRLTSDTTDYGWYKPLIDDAVAAAAAMAAAQPPAPPAGTGEDDTASGNDDHAAGPADGSAQEPAGPIGLVLADAGYCSEDNLTGDGPDRLIATGKRRTLENRARAAAAGEPPGGTGDQGDDPPAVASMTARLATEDGLTAYRRRGHIAETPHGDIKHNMGLRQLNLRGIRNAAAEWTFACAVHNLRKAISSGHLTQAALATMTTPAR